MPDLSTRRRKGEEKGMERVWLGDHREGVAAIKSCKQRNSGSKSLSYSSYHFYSFCLSSIP